jgi:hypothetical protein
MIHELKFNTSDRMSEFSKNIFKVKVVFIHILTDIQKVMDFNFEMLMYSNKELVEITCAMFNYA